MQKVLKNHWWPFEQKVEILKKNSFLALEAEGDLVDQFWGHTCERYLQNGDFLFSNVFCILKYSVTRTQKAFFENSKNSPKNISDPPGDTTIRFLVQKTSEIVKIDQKTKTEPKYQHLPRKIFSWQTFKARAGKINPPPTWDRVKEERG